MSEFHGTTSSWDRATLADGTELAYHVHKGTGTGRIALVHSLAMNGRFWDQVTPLLSEASEILIYDCRGHGSSSTPKGPYDAALFADDLRQLFDQLGWETAAVAGASMGGCVAQAFAIANPQRTSGLGLVGTTAWYGADAPEKWAARGKKGFDEGMEALIGFQLQRWFSAEYAQAHPDIVERLIATFTATDPAAYVEICHMMGAFDARDGLAKLDMPCEVFVGENDMAAPVVMAQYLSDSIPAAHLEIVADCHHLAPVEQPAAVARALNRLLARLAA